MLSAALALVLFAADPAAEAKPQPELDAFLARLELQPFIYDKQVHPRVVRDPDGNIIRLSLNEYVFVDDDWRAIEKIETLQSLGLFKSSVTNDDLARLAGLPKLSGIVLSSTEVTDEAIIHVANIASLRSACLFDVRITPEGKAKLKSLRPDIGVGYHQRKP